MQKLTRKTPLREVPGWVLTVRVLVGGAAAAYTAFHLLHTKDAVDYQNEKKAAERASAETLETVV